MAKGIMLVRGLACGAVLAALGACAGTESPSGLTAQGPAMTSAPNLPGAVSWRSPELDPTRYSKFIITPVKIYNGPDAKYGKATEADKQAMATFMQREFTRTIGERYGIASAPGPNTARLELTLAGLSDNIPVASTASSIAPIGLVSNMVRGEQQPIFSGSVTYKGDVYDSRTGELLASFVSTKTPPPLDLGATIDDRAAQQAAISAAAKDARDAIQSAQQAAARPAGR